MSILSTEGPASSRTFRVSEMEAALMKMPPERRLHARRLIRAVDNKTGIGYYAAADFVATLGLFLSKKSS